MDEGTYLALVCAASVDNVGIILMPEDVGYNSLQYCFFCHSLITKVSEVNNYQWLAQVVVTKPITPIFKQKPVIVCQNFKWYV